MVVLVRAHQPRRQIAGSLLMGLAITSTTCFVNIYLLLIVSSRFNSHLSIQKLGMTLLPSIDAPQQHARSILNC